jgi:hypothetical protein
MKLLTIKLVSAGSFLLTALSLVAYAQQPTTTPEPSAQPAADPIVGAWKLNSDKSTNPPAASELITIVPQGSQFNLDFDIKQDNKYNPHYKILTDMRGDAVKPTYANGQGTTSSWRVTRQSPKAFEMELLGPFGGWKDEYEVSADGKEMTMRRIPSNGGIVAGKMDSKGAVHSVQVIMVFDRVR